LRTPSPPPGERVGERGHRKVTMSFLTSSSGTNATSQTVYAGIQLQTSAQGKPIALVWGKGRVSPNLIWYSDFQAHKHEQKGGGGKGGGSSGTTYTYTAAIMLAICEGPILQVEAIWASQSQYLIDGLAKLGLTLFTGTANQNVWSF